MPLVCSHVIMPPGYSFIMITYTCLITSQAFFFAHNFFGLPLTREQPRKHPIEFSCVSCPRASAPSAPQSRTCVFQLLNPAVRVFVKQASLPLPPCHRDTYTRFRAVGMRQTVNRRPFAEPIAIGSPPERPASPAPFACAAWNAAPTRVPWCSHRTQ